MTGAAVHISLLVVDDSKTSCMVLGRQLQQLGYDVGMVYSGKEALAMLPQKNYQMMLLDCFMPDMDGFDVVKQIRQDEQATLQHLPVIGISGETDIEHKKMCLVYGMDGVLEKPIDLSALKAMIELWCPQPDYNETAMVPKQYSADYLQTLFNETTQSDLAALEASVAVHDWGNSRRLTHRMKGAALTLGKHDIAEQTLQLELLLKECTIEVHLYQKIIQAIRQML